MIGKKAQSGDYLAFFVFVIGLMALFIFSVLIIQPNIGGKKANDIQVEMEDLSSNIFLYGFLRQNVDDMNMVELIAFSHMNKDCKKLKDETTNLLEHIQEEVKFKIYINNKEMKECSLCTKCKEIKEEFTTVLPLPNKETIDFRLVLYET